MQIALERSPLDNDKDMRTGVRFDNRELWIECRLCRIAHLDADDYKFLDNPEPLISELRKSKLEIDLFTFLQKLPDTSPKYPYPYRMDNLAVLPISTFDHWWTKQIGVKTRNKARLAEKKGVVVREAPFDDMLVNGIWQIYNESPVRQGRLFPHYGKSLEAIREMSATYPDSSLFIGAFDRDRLIGFIKLTIDDSGTQAGIMHIMSLLGQKDKSPTNALVARAVRSCADRGISHLVYSKFAYGKRLRSSLSDFKERNGFQPIDIPRYYVPLTRWGSLIFTMGLHRTLIDLVPEPIGAKLREVRAAWYRHKFKLDTNSI
jgi:hypothetical protein